MIQMTTQLLPHKSLYLLSRLLLSPGAVSNADEVLQMTRTEFESLVALSGTNHVLVRGISVFRDIAQRAEDGERLEWANTALAVERARIDRAISFLSRICDVFRSAGRRVAVIKSLDHLPDLGSDLDLYTDAEPADVIRLMQEEFSAQLDSRSWGDRLAGKWNFMIPGLPELVEIHVGKLGQTGEQFAIASSLLGRTRSISANDYVFRVPSISDRLMISTLQRMYRHFYFRLCDIVDSAGVVRSGSVDWSDLLAAATTAGIWEGVATYLAIVSDYVNRYRGVPLELPEWVLSAARFRGEEIYFAKDFLRVPIVPQSAMLYGTQLAAVLRRRHLESGARLSLLPWLATAALVGQKITGSDKGIW